MSGFPQFAGFTSSNKHDPVNAADVIKIIFSSQLQSGTLRTVKCQDTAHLRQYFRLLKLMININKHNNFNQMHNWNALKMLKNES